MLLATVALYTVVALASAAYFNPAQGRPLHLYFQAVIVVACGLSVYSLKELSFSSKKIQASGCILFLLGALSWFLYRKEFLLTYSPWFDEITQFFQYQPAPIDETLHAALQQQPPLDYTFSAFARHIYGVSEISMVSHAVAFSMLSQVVLLLWLRLVQLPVLLAPLPLLLFAAQGTLLRYSSEARPISLAIFFSSLSLFFLYERIKKKTSVLPLLAAAIFFFYSNGLQPHFFLLFMALAFLPWSLLVSSKKEALLTFSAFFLLPTLLFLPNLYEIYVECVRYAQFHGENHFQHWLIAIMNIKLSALRAYWGSFHPVQFLLLLPLLTLALGIKNKSKTLLAISLGTFVFLFFYPLAFQIFWATINWGLRRHYFSTWISGSIFLLTLHLAWQARTLTSSKIKLAALPLLAATFFYLHFYFVPAQQDMVNVRGRVHPDWRVLDALGKKAKQPAYFLQIPFDFLSSSKDHDHVGDLYPHTKNLKLGSCPDFGRYRLQPEFRQLHGGLILYAKMRKEIRSQILPRLQPLTKEIIEMNENFVAFTVQNEKSVMENIETIYQAILAAYPNQPENLFLLAGLLELAQEEKRPVGKILSQIQALQEKEPEVQRYLQLAPKPAATAQ